MLVLGQEQGTSATGLLLCACGPGKAELHEGNRLLANEAVE